MKRIMGAAAAGLAVLLIAGCEPSGHVTAPAPAEGAPAQPADAFSAVVVRVVDGDTFIARRVAGGSPIRVRIIGIDSPETVKPKMPVQCFGPQASAYLSGRISGIRVRAAYEGAQHVDKFGRDLWDVWLPDGTFVAGAEVAQGYARALRIRPQTWHAGYLAALQDAARAAGKGLWAACPTQ